MFLIWPFNFAFIFDKTEMPISRKRIIRWGAVVILFPIVYIVATILFALISEYKPSESETLSPEFESNYEQSVIQQDSSLSFVIWNIGYGGLGAESDFFYDGGKMAVPSKALVDKYTRGIYDFVKKSDSVDFFLFQEVDRQSKRSHNKDEARGIAENLQDYTGFFALNYDVNFMPMPLFSPMGKIKSGLLSCSKYSSESAQRISLPNITDFPRKTLYLKRCVLLQRYKLANGKELVVINAHLEAYDEGGLVKKAQMKLLKDLLVKEYNNGNYVVLGGDWNIAPPNFDVHKWESDPITDELYLLQNDPDYIPNWQYAADMDVPTNRKLAKPYNPKTTYKTVIDYFLVSPNVTVERVEGIDLDFAFSDHNPVLLTIKLNTKI